MTDIYIPKGPPVLQNTNHGLYTVGRASCKANVKNWRLCAENAEARGDGNQVLYCQAKAKKIAGWLEDLIEEGAF